MRFLHTADWHVGKTLRGRDRMDEFAAALDEVACIAIDSKVDAILVGGDVFDTATPPVEAEVLVYEFLARFVPERIPVVMIAGNHDHPRRLEALRQLLESLDIHVRSEVRSPSEGGIVTLPSRDGSESARIAVLPFVHERKVVDACRLMGPEDEWYDEYARRVGQMLTRLASGFASDTVNIALAHLLVSGARVGTGERRLHVAESYGIEAALLPAEAQYVALGHLHRPQQVAEHPLAFYSGSLLELDFGERDQEKRVVLVEARPGDAARIESLPLRSGRRLRDVIGTIEELQTRKAELGSDLLRVRLRVKEPQPGLADRVRGLLPGAVEVGLDYERVGLAPLQRRDADLDPSDLYQEFCRRRLGREPDAELARLFAEVYDEASAP